MKPDAIEAIRQLTEGRKAYILDPENAVLSVIDNVLSYVFSPAFPFGSINDRLDYVSQFIEEVFYGDPELKSAAAFQLPFVASYHFLRKMERASDKVSSICGLIDSKKLGREAGLQILDYYQWSFEYYRELAVAWPWVAYDFVNDGKRDFPGIMAGIKAGFSECKDICVTIGDASTIALSMAQSSGFLLHVPNIALVAKYRYTPKNTSEF